MKITFTLLICWLSLLVYSQNLTQVTTSIADEVEIDWSPDGQYFCYSSYIGGISEIWKIDVTGQNPVQLTFDNGLNRYPQWSPTGNYISYTSEKSGNKDIWLHPIDGGEDLQFTSYRLSDDDGHWNHDGTEIIYASEISYLGELNIMKKSLITGDSVNLSNSIYSEIPWHISPDGTKIAFTSYESGYCDLYLMDYNGNNRRRLTFNNPFESGVCWSPDGKYLAYGSNIIGFADIWILPIAGGEAIQFTFDPSWEQSPTWSPDGTKIAFTSHRSGNLDIWIKEFNITSVTQLSKEEQNLIIYPNPAQENAIISYSLSNSSNIKVTITDFSGKLIKTLVNKKQAKGEYQLVWNLSNKLGQKVPPGIYFCSLLTNSKIKNEKIIVTNKE